MFAKDFSWATLEAFRSSIASLRYTDLRPRVGEIKMPVMGMYGRKDRIVDPKEGEVLVLGNSS